MVVLISFKTRFDLRENNEQKRGRLWCNQKDSSLRTIPLYSRLVLMRTRTISGFYLREMSTDDGAEGSLKVMIASNVCIIAKSAWIQIKEFFSPNLLEGYNSCYPVLLWLLYFIVIIQLYWLLVCYS